MSCGQAPWDITKPRDRLAMQQEVRNLLTNRHCSSALNLSQQLYESAYTDNTIRMLYVSAQACNMGISLYDLLDDITTADFTTQDAIFKSLVRLFPSKAATDTRLQSSMLAQDILHSIIPVGTVLGVNDRYNATTVNPASILFRDRTRDANIYLTFTSMSLVGNALNRYGFNPADDPIAFAYAQQVDLTWTTQALIQADTSGEGCALASGLLNMLDGIGVLGRLAPAGVADALNLISSNLLNALNSAAHLVCDPLHTDPVCDQALIRLRYRGACAESLPPAASAAGIIQAVNLGWAN